MLNSNNSIKNFHVQKLANQSILYGALVIEMVNARKKAKKKKNISAFEIINVVVPDPTISLWIAASVADATAVKPNVIK